MVNPLRFSSVSTLCPFILEFPIHSSLFHSIRLPSRIFLLPTEEFQLTFTSVFRILDILWRRAHDNNMYLPVYCLITTDQQQQFIRFLLNYVTPSFHLQHGQTEQSKYSLLLLLRSKPHTKSRPSELYDYQELIVLERNRESTVLPTYLNFFRLKAG